MIEVEETYRRRGFCRWFFHKFWAAGFSSEIPKVRCFRNLDCAEGSPSACPRPISCFFDPPSREHLFYDGSDQIRAQTHLCQGALSFSPYDDHDLTIVPVQVGCREISADTSCLRAEHEGGRLARWARWCGHLLGAINVVVLLKCAVRPFSASSASQFVQSASHHGLELRRSALQQGSQGTAFGATAAPTESEVERQDCNTQRARVLLRLWAERLLGRVREQNRGVGANPTE